MDLRTDLPGMHAHPENEILWTQVDESGVSGSGRGELYEAKSVKVFWVSVDGI